MLHSSTSTPSHLTLPEPHFTDEETDAQVAQLSSRSTPGRGQTLTCLALMPEPFIKPQLLVRLV